MEKQKVILEIEYNVGDYDGHGEVSEILTSLVEQELSILEDDDVLNDGSVTDITTDTFSFTGTAKDLENGHTGLWTDGVMIDCDNERNMAYMFVAGKKYKISIEEVN